MFLAGLTDFFHRARSRITSVVQPLLDGLSGYTEYTLCLLCGRQPSEPGGKFDLVSYVLILLFFGLARQLITF